MSRKRLKNALAAAALLAGVSSAPAQLMTTGAGGNGGSGSPAVTLVTPFMTVEPSANPSTSQINYIAPYAGQYSSFGAVITVSQAPWPVSGTLSKLQVYFGSAPASGAAWTVALNVGGTVTSLSCYITSSGQTCTDPTDTVSVSPGNLVTIEVCPSEASSLGTGCPTSTQCGGTCSAPATPTAPFVVSFDFTSTIGESLVCFPGNHSLSNTASLVQYASPQAPGGWNSTEAVVSGVMPEKGAYDRLYALASATVTTGSYTAEAALNGTPTGPSCNPASTSSPCNNAGTPFTANVGDTISMSVTNSGSAPTSITGINACMRFIPDATANPGKVPLMSVASTEPTQAATRAWPADGGMIGSTTIGGAGALSVTPNFGTSMVLSNLIVADSPAPSASTRTVTLVTGSTPNPTITSGNPSCFVSTTSTLSVAGSLNGASGCVDNTDTYSATQGSPNYLGFKVVSGTGTGTPTWFKSSVAAAVQ